MTHAERKLAGAWQRGQQAIANGDMPTAERELSRVASLDPDNAMAAILAAGAVLAQGRMQAATPVLLGAARRPPTDAALLCRLAQALLRTGDVAAACTLMDAPTVDACREATILGALAHVEQSLGRHPRALALMQRAASAGMASGEFLYFLGLQHQFNGQLAEAEWCFASSLAKAPGLGRAQLTLSRMRRQSADRNHLPDIARGATLARSDEDAAAFCFAAYKEYEDLGDAASAWAQLARGNARMAARLRHDPRREAALVDGLLRTFATIVPGDGASIAGPVPIFILGLPRSGTTLLERLIGRHPRVLACGELGDFPRQLRWEADVAGTGLLDDRLLQRLPGIDLAAVGRGYLAQTQWRAGGRAFYTDKLPPNYLLAGLIARALPQAPILHLRRDPMDVCFSNYRALFGEAYPYSYDLDALAAHYVQYARLMSAWHDAIPGRILDVDYQRLVDDPENTLREALDHCGLGFDPACLDHDANLAPVATLSSAQVQGKIDRRGIGAWRAYADRLQPLRDALARDRIRVG